MNIKIYLHRMPYRLGACCVRWFECQLVQVPPGADYSCAVKSRHSRIKYNIILNKTSCFNGYIKLLIPKVSKIIIKRKGKQTSPTNSTCPPPDAL